VFEKHVVCGPTETSLAAEDDSHDKSCDLWSVFHEINLSLTLNSNGPKNEFQVSFERIFSRHSGPENTGEKTARELRNSLLAKVYKHS